jgi:hypothetical protein
MTRVDWLPWRDHERRPSNYKDFAESYYEKKLDIDAIEQIYRHEILTTKIISGLNGEITLQS